MLLYLIRHGRTDWNEIHRVMGHSPIPLNEPGRAGVEALARAMATESIRLIYTSPVARAAESAAILARAWEAETREEPDLAESAFEDWVGKTYDELRGDEQFALYMRRPARARFSRSEGMADVQRRALAAVERIRREAAGAGRAAAVSHSDVIKPVLAHYLGMSLDHMHRLAVANASVSLVDFFHDPPRIRFVNVVPGRWGAGR